LNCQEARNLVEHVIDRNLSGGVKRRFDLHLSRCEECRAFFAAERAEHQRWFRAVNSPEGPRHSLPPDFADRLAAAVVAHAALHRPFFLRRPRWALLAASLALMAGFVFAAVVVEEIRGAEAANQDGMAANQDGMVANQDGMAANQDGDAGGEGPTINYQLPTTNYRLETNPGETTMTRRKAVAAALTAAMAAAPLAAANGDEYQFIIAGDPVAAATVGSSSATSAEITLETGALRVAGAADDLEARSRSKGASVAIALNATKFRTFIMTVR